MHPRHQQREKAVRGDGDSSTRERETALEPGAGEMETCLSNHLGL